MEVHDLTFRMRAGVGAPGRVDGDRLARDRAQCPLQLCLNGPAGSLLLPAGKARTVVLQHDFDIHFLTAVRGHAPLPDPLLWGEMGFASPLTRCSPSARRRPIEGPCG